MIKDEYQKLKKLHSQLPEYELLDHEFEICDIEKNRHILRQIRRKIEERLENIAMIIGGILQPDTNLFSSMIECDAFTEEEKKELLEHYERLMTLYRGLLEADLILEEKKEVETIKIIGEQWPALRKKLVPIATKLKERWKSPGEVKEILEYLG